MHHQRHPDDDPSPSGGHQGLLGGQGGQDQRRVRQDRPERLHDRTAGLRETARSFQNHDREQGIRVRTTNCSDSHPPPHPPPPFS